MICFNLRLTCVNIGSLSLVEQLNLLLLASLNRSWAHLSQIGLYDIKGLSPIFQLWRRHWRLFVKNLWLFFNLGLQLLFSGYLNGDLLLYILPLIQFFVFEKFVDEVWSGFHLSYVFLKDLVSIEFSQLHVIFCFNIPKLILNTPTKLSEPRITHYLVCINLKHFPFVYKSNFDFLLLSVFDPFLVDCLLVTIV